MSYGIYDNAHTTSALLWDNGRMRVVNLPEGDFVRELEDVNSTGTAVGNTTLGDEVIPWVVRGGKATRLPGIRGYAGDVHGINERGQIAGAIDAHPVVWETADGRPKRLALPGAEYRGAAEGIDEDGTVVGTLMLGGGSAGYIWSPDGQISQLPVPQLDGRPAAEYSAWGIRNGWVVGRIGQGGNTVRWRLHDGGPPEVISDLWGNSEVVTAHGWTLQSDVSHVAISTGESRIDLPPPPGAKVGSNMLTVSALGDDGRTVGGTADKGDHSGEQFPVRWTCR